MAKSQKQAAKKKPRKSQNEFKPSFWKKYQMPALALFALGTLLYIYTCSFQYALDDQIVITENTYTKQGFGGLGELFTTDSFEGFFGKKKDLVEGGRYRPLSMATFAIEYALFKEKPAFSHFLNVLLYGLTGMLVFYLLCLLIPPDPHKPWYFSFAFIATALFLAHPLHTEAIANIKGRDEIMTFLGSIAALYCSVRYVTSQSSKHLIATGIIFFLALLSKESAITFLAVIPLTLFVFTKAKPGDYTKIMASLFGATVLFLLIRYQVIGYFLGSDKQAEELLNNPYLNTSVSDKFATVFYTLLLYIKLLFFPLQLTHDYYPKQIPILSWSDWRAILSLVIHLALGIAAVVGLLRKKVWAYGIAYYIITLSIVSNLVFNIGTFMNERFLYMPSLGFCIIIAWLLVKKMPELVKSNSAQKIALGSFAALLLLYSVRTFARIPAWKDNRTLFLTDVLASPNSTKANTSAGGTLLEQIAGQPMSSSKKAKVTKAVGYLEKAIQIYPGNHNTQLLLGNAYIENQEYSKVYEPYYALLQNNPNHSNVHANLFLLAEFLTDKAQVKELVRFLEEKVVPLGPNTAKPYTSLGVLYGKKLNDLGKSIANFQTAMSFDDAESSIAQDLATAYGFQGDFENSIKAGLQAVKMSPTNAKAHLNLAVSYQNLGNEEKAKFYFDKAFALDPSLQRK